MSYAGVNGLSMFGLSHDAVVYLIEQLYGARNCRNYKFLFNDYEPVELEEVHTYVIYTKCFMNLYLWHLSEAQLPYKISHFYF